MTSTGNLTNFPGGRSESKSVHVTLSEDDAVMESNYRKLLGFLESERVQIRKTWSQIQQERDSTSSELDRLRSETENWCCGEKAKIDGEWKRLDVLSERMQKLWPPETPDIVEINCSGKAFTVPRSTLCSIEDSNLGHMFSDVFIQHIPKDPQGRLYIDFNPECFTIIVDYLQNRRLRPDAPVPVIPAKHQQSMDLLAEALKLKPFLSENQVSAVHATSLCVTGNMIQAMHPGWQVISSSKPLPLAGASYFEVKILSNPNTSGGLAVGVCGHIPAGDEVHSIRLADSVLYNSHNGLMGDCFESDDVEKGVQLLQGDVLGIRHDISKHCVQWYYNSRLIGSSPIKEDSVEKMRIMYPVFGLYAPDTIIQVDFNPPDPERIAAAENPES